MTRETQLTTLAQGRRMRVTKLDSCGRPVYGDGSTVTSDGFVSVSLKLETNDTDAIEVKNANGRRIIYKKPSSSLSGYDVEIEMAEVDPELYGLMTGQPIFVDADGNYTGFGADSAVDSSSVSFALEVWAGVTGDDGCDDEDAEGSWGYILFPFIQGGLVGDHEVQNDALTFTITDATTVDGNGWGKGPYDVTLNLATDPSDPKVAGPLLEALSPTLHELFIPVLVEPPVALAGSRPLLDPDATLTTALTPTLTSGSLVVSFAVTPDTAEGTGVWYEFGDGTWDFADSPGDITHTYAKAGTYVAQASTNGVWVTHSVTVPGV